MNRIDRWRALPALVVLVLVTACDATPPTRHLLRVGCARGVRAPGVRPAGVGVASLGSANHAADPSPGACARPRRDLGAAQAGHAPDLVPGAALRNADGVREGDDVHQGGVLGQPNRHEGGGRLSRDEARRRRRVVMHGEPARPGRRAGRGHLHVRRARRGRAGRSVARRGSTRDLRGSAAQADEHALGDGRAAGRERSRGGPDVPREAGRSRLATRSVPPLQHVGVSTRHGQQERRHAVLRPRHAVDVASWSSWRRPRVTPPRRRCT